MVELVKSSVSVTYASDDSTVDKGPPTLLLRQDTVHPPYGFAFARLYFTGATPTTTATSGYPVTVVSSNVVSDELEFIMFTGSVEASFPTPSVSNVSVKPLGRFVGGSGETVSSVSFVVDAARGTLTANKPFYGAVQVTYNSSYTRLSAQFGEIPGAKDDTRYPSEFSPMVLVATTTKSDAAYLSLTPPNKDERRDQKGGAMTGEDKSTGEAIVLELDSTFPVSLTHSAPHIAGLAAVARVAVYSPHAGVSFVSSAGHVATDKYNIDEVLDIKETVAFVGAQSMSVKYPPANGIHAQAIGNVSSKATGGGNFFFVTAPYTVSLAEWFGYATYQLTGTREVVSNEIVATSSGVALPVSGMVRAEYSTRRTYVTVTWARDGDWFPPVVLVATDIRGNTTSLTISAPERRGR